MKGVTDFYLNNQIEDLCVSLKYAIEHPNELSTKIDGKPALVIWSDFPGLRGPGVGFKSLIKQVQDNRAKDYFTSDREIYNFMLSKDLEEGERVHRTNAFISALKLSPKVRPGVMIWGDVLFTDNEKTIKDNKCYFTPNTITYEVDTHTFPEVKSGNFGIVFHTVIDSKFNQEKILDVFKYMDESEEFVICPEDIQISLKKLNNISYELGKAYEKAEELSIHFTEDLLKKLRKLYKKLNISKSDLISNFDESDRDFISEIYDNISNFNKIKEDIINSVHINGFNSYIKGVKTNGEGFVVNVPNCEPLKLVSDSDFTSHNIEHMKSLKERIVDDGQTVLAWSSSKDTQLFNYYLTKNLKYGDNGGSNYGFATYCVTEPPFTEGAQVGYSDEYRRKLYGDNIFEFKIPTDKIIFFDYQDYLKSKQGQTQQASFDNFVKVQIQALGVRMTDEEYQSLQPVDEKKPTASVAVKFYQIMSRYFYQGHRGNLRTPIDGFQYRGRNDGNTLVIWNSNRLIPVKYSNDLGQTWQECDKNSEVYKEYLKAAENANYAINEPKYKDSIFDGHKTPEKKEIYRLLMAFNSNDGVNEKGKSLGLSDGIFYNIVIKDDKTINASFKFNLPYVDYGEHFFRLRKNQFLDQIFDKGYRFGKLDCGLKIGSEHNPNETWESVEDRWWPEEVTGGFKLVCLPVNSKQFKCFTKIGQKKLYLTKCHIEEDVFDGWEVILDPEKPNFCKKEVKDQLTKKYDWANNLTEEEPLMESALKKFKLKEAYRNTLEPELEQKVRQIMSDCDLIFANKDSNGKECRSISDSISNSKDNGRLIWVKHDISKGFLKRDEVILNFENYISNQPNLEMDHYEPAERIVYFTIDEQPIGFRFRVIEGETGRQYANKNAFNSESVFAFLLENANDPEFINQNLESILKKSGIDLSFFNNKYRTTFEKAVMNVYAAIGFRAKLKVERSETSELGKRIERLVKTCSGYFTTYKKWNPADVWIYPEKDWLLVDAALSKCEQELKVNKDDLKTEEERLNHLYKFNEVFIDLANRKKLTGFSVKALGSLSNSESFRTFYSNMGVFERNKTDIFKEIKGLDNINSMKLISEWFPITGYYYRPGNYPTSSAVSFNISDKNAQASWCSYDFYKDFDLIKSTFKNGEFSNIMSNGLNLYQVKLFASTVLKSGIVNEPTTNKNGKLENSKEIVQGWDNNPNSFLEISPKKLMRVKSQQLAVSYALANATPEERNWFCTQVWEYSRKKNRKFGPYMYVGHIEK